MLEMQNKLENKNNFVTSQKGLRKHLPHSKHVVITRVPLFRDFLCPIMILILGDVLKLRIYHVQYIHIYRQVHLKSCERFEFRKSY